MSSFVRLGFFTIVVVALALTAPPATAQLSITVSSRNVRIGGITPGGEVVLFSNAKLSREGGGTHLQTKAEILIDDDKDGVVSLETDVPLRSVWIAVDATSGAAVAGADPEFPLSVAPIAPTLYRKDADEEIAAIEQRIPRLLLLIVRPGKGAWILRGRDGDFGDRDGTANGVLRLAFEDALAFVAGKDKAPKHLKNGDVVALVDPGRFDVFLGQVAK